MLRRYHQGLIERANKVAANGSPFAMIAAMQRDAIIWALPALAALAICSLAQLSGSSSLWVSVPLVSASIAGCVFYVGLIYGAAIKRRRDR